MNAFLPLSIVALTAFAGAAAAENTFTLDRANTSASRVALTGVQADQASTVEVYSREDGGTIRFLGSSRVAAGTTGAVDVALSSAPKGEVTILLSNGNYAVSTLTTNDLPAD